MSKYSDVREMAQAISGKERIVSIPAMYIEITGEWKAAGVLNQLVFWCDKGGRADGFIYKTYADWEVELYLSEYEVRRATNKLKGMGLVETSLKKANGVPTLHYRLNEEAFDECLATYLMNRRAKKSFRMGSEETKEPNSANGLSHKNPGSEETKEPVLNKLKNGNQRNSRMEPEETKESLTEDYYSVLPTDNKHDDDDTRTRETPIQESNPEPKEKPLSDSDRRNLNCRAYYLDNIGPLDPGLESELDGWVETMGEDMVLEAIFRGIGVAETFSYIRTTLQGWKAFNIRTLDGIKADDTKNRRKRAYRNDPPATEQRQASTPVKKAQYGRNTYGAQPKQEKMADIITNEEKYRVETMPETPAELARKAEVQERIKKLRSTNSPLTR